MRSFCRKTSRMLFVFSGEKKSVALLFLVVVFGTTFGTSLIKNQLEVCHLLEGTQDDLATRNSSNAKAENLKEGILFDAITYRANSTAVDSRINLSRSGATAVNLSIIKSHFGLLPRLHPSNSTAMNSRINLSHSGATAVNLSINKSHFGLLPRLHPSNSTANGSHFGLIHRSSFESSCFGDVASAKVSGGLFPFVGTAVEKVGSESLHGIQFLLKSLANFGPNIDRLYLEPCNITFRRFGVDPWFAEFHFPLCGERYTNNFVVLLDYFRRKQKCVCSNFVSRVVLVAIVFTSLVAACCHDAPRIDITPQGAADVWRSYIERSVPRGSATFEEYRTRRGYKVVMTLRLRRGVATYVCVSRESLSEAYMYILMRLDQRNREIDIQGIVRALGYRENDAIKFIKCTFFFAYAYWRSRNIADRVICTTHWIDQLLDIGPANNLRFGLADFYMTFVKLPVVRSNRTSTSYRKSNQLTIALDLEDSDSDIEPQGLDEYAASLNNFLKGVFHSSSIKACLRLISLVWHLLFVFKEGSIDWEHLSKWDAAMFHSIPEKVLNVGSIVLEQFQNLATSSWEFWKTKDPNVFLRNDNEVTKFLETVERLAGEVKLLPIEPKLSMDITDMEKRIHTLIQQGEVLRPRVKQSIRPVFTSGLLQLRSLALEVATMARASSSRAAPYTLLVNGPPKIGKSSITSLIFRQFQKTNPYNTVLQNGLELHDNGVYTRTLKEEYWSCYMNSNWGILYDDLGQTNPKVPEFAMEINEIIQVVNNVMFFPQMAGVDEKGTRYVAPQIVIATTNNRDINAHHAVRSAGAVLRRFPYVITPRVREEFSDRGTLDGKKVGDEVDLWTFDIDEVVIRAGGNDVTYRTVERGLSTQGMLKWVNKSSLEHFRGQANGDSFAKRVLKSSNCKFCSALCLFCDCAEKRADEFRKVFLARKVFRVRDVILAQKRMFDAYAKQPEPLNPFAFLDNEDGAQEEPEWETVYQDPYYLPSRPSISQRVLLFSVMRKYFNILRSNVSEIKPVKPQAKDGDECIHVVPQSVGVRQFVGFSIVVFSLCQVLLTVLFLERMAREPVKWILGLWKNKQEGIIRDGGQVPTASRIFMNLIGNFWSFNPMETVAILWMSGWIRFAGDIRSRIIVEVNYLYRNPKFIAAIAVGLTTGMLLRWYWNFCSQHGFTTQGENEPPIDPGVKPPAADSNVENVWKNSSMLGSSAFLSHQSRTGNKEWFDKQMEICTATLNFDCCSHSITGFNIFGQYWILPKHFTNTPKFARSKMVTVTRCVSGGKDFAAYHGAFDQESVVHDPRSDYTLIKLNLPPGANLLPYLSTFSLGQNVSAVSAFMRDSGIHTVACEPVKIKKAQLPAISELNGNASNTDYQIGEYATNFETVNGDCGSPIFVSEKGRMVILGSHAGVVSMSPKIKICMLYPTEWLKEQYSKMDYCVVQGTLSTEKLDGTSVEVTDNVHDKCPLRFEGLSDMPMGNSAIPVGQLKGFALNRFSTQVRENIFAPFWKGLGYATSKVRPVLSSVNCPSWMPKRNFLMNACQHKDLIPYDLLRKCSDHYFNRLVSRIPSSSIKKCVIIDEETNLYGAEGNNFISHMQFNTGAGFPHGGPKYQVLDRVAHPKFPGGTCALPAKMKDNISRMEKNAALGIRANFVFNSSLKDEPISEKKLKEGKIRVFQAINVEGLFLLRKYFLSIVAMFQTWNFAAEAAIGMDATGPDWDDIHDHIFVDGWQVFCGDYSNYDQRMGSSIMMQAWGIVIGLAMMSGNYTKSAIQIMYVLATECCYCVVNFFGDLLCLNGSNPSGHALTVVINSICNSLYIRLAWLDIFGDLEEFDRGVRVMTYGDDNIVSVHPSFQHKFNQIAVTNALAKYGIVYTDAQKTGEIKPFCAMEEISFLKRGFVRSEEGFWNSPLEIASIHKMLIIGVNSGKVQEKDRLSSVLISSVMEAFQHGREFFEQHLGNAQRCAVEYGLEEWILNKGGFPTYELMLERRREKISRLQSLQHLC